MHPTPLLEDLKNLLPWNLARLHCFVSMIFGVLTSGSVQQHQMALGFPLGPVKTAKKPSKDASIIARIQSFFRCFPLKYDDIARALIQLSRCQGPYRLALDRTNWKFGRLHINFLVLAVVVNQTVAFPVLWTILPKAGNSNSAERIDLLQRFISLFGANSIAEITADREFIGKPWIDFLLVQKIPFIIRIKENRLVEFGSGSKNIINFFNHLNGKETREAEFRMDGYRLYFQGARTPTNDLIIVMSNYSKPNKLLKKYKNRWTIELMFKHLKSNGFNLEDSHFVHLDRLEKLFAVVTFAMLISYLTGKIQEKIRKTPYKKTVKAPLFSTFRRGFDWLKRLLINNKSLALKHFHSLFKKILG